MRKKFEIFRYSLTTSCFIAKVPFSKLPETYSKPCPIPKMELGVFFKKIKSTTILAKSFNLDVWIESECTPS